VVDFPSVVMALMLNSSTAGLVHTSSAVVVSLFGLSADDVGLVNSSSSLVANGDCIVWVLGWWQLSQLLFFIGGNGDIGWWCLGLLLFLFLNQCW
jgi:hypothetical protein